MSYSAELVIAPNEDGRQSSRRVVNFAGFVRDAGATAVSVTALDLSTEGCRLRCSAELEVETLVLLKIGGLPAVRARIVWSRTDEAGCEFLTPLDSGIVDQVVTVVRPSVTRFGARR